MSKAMNRDEMANVKTQPAGKQGYQQPPAASKRKVRKSSRKSSR